MATDSHKHEFTRPRDTRGLRKHPRAGGRRRSFTGGFKGNILEGIQIAANELLMGTMRIAPPPLNTLQ